MLIIKELHDACMCSHMSISVAESCTAGNIASAITSIPGSSKYFKGGVIVYQNEIKINVLGVSKTSIESNTEVSYEVVKQMANNVRLKFNSDFSIATSGYMGPGGGTEINPVGTVFIAIASNSEIIVSNFLFKGDRQSIVNQTTEKSLHLLSLEVKKANKV